jgi:hypothetical protein
MHAIDFECVVQEQESRRLAPASRFRGSHNRIATNDAEGDPAERDAQEARIRDK